MGSITPSNSGKEKDTVLHDTIQIALREAQARYTAEHPVSKCNHQEACKYMPGGNTRTVLHTLPFPLTIASGKSCYLTTAEDKTYIDFLGEYTAGIYGHDNPLIREAVERALQGGWNYGGVTLMEQQLAKMVCERFSAIELVRFVNSGTEANMMALATAVVATRRKAIIVFYGAYHGGTISGKTYPGKASINLPHRFVVGEYNDIQATRELVDTLKDDLAAIIVEPMLGSGGCFPARREFLQLLRDLSTQHGAVLIFDEVMTSRLGYHGTGHLHGIAPDLMTLGKWVGGGMTFGAFGGKESLMRMYDPRRGELEHPGTFNNNVFTMTAGVAGCKILTQDRLQQLNDLGEGMRAALTKIFSQYQIEGRIPETLLHDEQDPTNLESRPPKIFVTGMGSLMNIHFSGPHKSYLQGLYYHHMLDHGIYMAARGFIALSIEIKQSHVDQFLTATKEFCQIWQEALRW